MGFDSNFPIVNGEQEEQWTREERQTNGARDFRCIHFAMGKWSELKSRIKMSDLIVCSMCMRLDKWITFGGRLIPVHRAVTVRCTFFRSPPPNTNSNILAESLCSFYIFFSLPLFFISLLQPFPPMLSLKMNILIFWILILKVFPSHTPIEKEASHLLKKKKLATSLVVSEFSTVRSKAM